MNPKLISTAIFPRFLESILELVFNLFSIYLVYLGFNWVIDVLTKGDFTGDTLLSILLLPALYVLKDYNKVIDPFTVKVEMYTDRISVTRGLNPRIEDTLEFKSVENNELITTLFGRIFNYSTIILYSPGGHVEMPYVYNAKKILDEINSSKKGILEKEDTKY